MSFDIKKHFPYAQIREQQSLAILYALHNFLKKDKRFVIVEAGTGVGKSAIGLTIGKYLNANLPGSSDHDPASWYLTTQKILQAQYVKDFGIQEKLRSVKSAKNHACKHSGSDCKEGQMLLRSCDKKSQQWKTCVFECPYKKEKKEFLEANNSVANFAYFMTETNSSGKITPRNLLVIDEAHNIEGELSRFIEVSVSERFAKSMLKLKFPSRATQFQAVKWIREEYFPAAALKLQFVESQIEKLGLSAKLDDLKKIAQSFEMLSSHVDKLRTFLSHYEKDNWVMELVQGQGRAMRKFTFRPIDVSPWAEQFLFRCGNKVLMLSATILNKTAFCDNLGITEEECAFISIPSPFPTENRPIMFFPAGKMSASYIDSTLPKLATMVSAILDEHKDDKGIIHCHSYKIAKYLKNNIKSKRLLIHNSENRDQVLEKHIKSKKNTVLLSPSMSEGVDLKEDLSRFQILCKVPYPYLGDPIIKKRMSKRKTWYPLQTAKTIVQSVGRSVRSKDDQAVTYILDQDWQRFFNRNKHFFPEDFKNCLKWS
jgi:ATP-dependent DNA helicase DinG